MTWEAVSAIGEIIGAIAVVVTLLFLIQQLRQNTEALRQQSERASADAIHTWSLAMMDPNVSKTISRGYVPSDEPLPPEALASLEHFVISLIVVLQQDYFDWKRGTQSDELWASRAGLIRGVFNSSEVKKWWETIGSEYVVPEFRAIIDETIAGSIDNTGDYWRKFK